MNLRKIAISAVLAIFCSFAVYAEEEHPDCKPVEIHNLVCGISFGTGCGLMGVAAMLGLLSNPEATTSENYMGFGILNALSPITATTCLAFGTVSIINFVKYKKHCDQCRNISLKIGPTKAELSLNF